jgi:hypothetical protein
MASAAFEWSEAFAIESDPININKAATRPIIPKIRVERKNIRAPSLFRPFPDASATIFEIATGRPAVETI